MMRPTKIVMGVGILAQAIPYLIVDYTIVVPLIPMTVVLVHLNLLVAASLLQEHVMMI
jgi:hypothetical protein